MEETFVMPLSIFTVINKSQRHGVIYFNKDLFLFRLFLAIAELFLLFRR